MATPKKLDDLPGILSRKRIKYFKLNPSDNRKYFSVSPAPRPHRVEVIENDPLTTKKTFPQ